MNLLINVNLFIILMCVLCTAYTLVVSYGEECQYTAECGDHRMVCEEVTRQNRTSKICVCDRYHEWNGTSIGCIQKYTTKEILAMTKEKHNVSERIESEANIVFLAQVAAGLIVLSVGLICSGVVSVYCYHMWKDDTELDELVRKLEEQNKLNKPCTSQPRK